MQEFSVGIFFCQPWHWFSELILRGGTPGLL